MNLLPLEKNKFANNKLKQYKDWWEQYHDSFLNGGIEVNKQYFPLLQRDYAEDSQLSKCSCGRNSIPYMEITPLYREANDGLLFVNCNPSGTDYSYYKEKNNEPPTDFFYYDKLDNTYFNATEEFAKAVGMSENYAMIDVFPIVMQNQAVLKKAFKEENEKRRDAFNKLIDLFLDSIEQIKPKVVIVTNAFVKDLFINGFDERVCVVPDEEKVCYNIKIQERFATTVFCGGMIAGGHQMDTESKKRLIRDVAYFMESSIGYKNKP